MSWSGYADDATQNAQDLARRAAGGDQQALAQLEQATRTWAPDHRNAAIDAYNSLGVGAPIGDIKNPHHGFLGALGDVLKVAAPIAGALIPGVGTLGGALIGGLGNSGGQLLSGDKFSPLQALGAGAAGGFGNKLLGNGLGSGSSNWGFGSAAAGGIPGMPGGAQPGNMTQSGAGVPGMPGSGIPGQAGGGLLDRFGDVGSLLQKYGPLALGAAGALNQASESSGADRLRNQATDIALQDWQSRAPLRARALAMTSDGSLTDPSNPYATRKPAVPAMPGGQR